MKNIRRIETYWPTSLLLSMKANENERRKQEMIYTKNVPTIERVLRALAGFALVALGLIAMRGTPLGYILAASGMVAVLTGFVGFCPMCALAGRRIQQNLEKQRKGETR